VLKKTLPLKSLESFYMVRYEALLLTIPEITADEVKSIESNLDRVMTEIKGSTLSFERWGKYKLAYPVKKNDYGIYFLVRFEMAQSKPGIDDVKTLFDVKLHDVIMRSMLTHLDAKQPLAYERPQSLEEVPARESSSFMGSGKRDGDYNNHSRHEVESESEESEDNEA
jgi:small subunit ribosomal protein S6